MPSARRATVSVATRASPRSAPCCLGRRDHLRARSRQRGDRRQRVHDLVGQHAHQVGLRGDLERAQFALHRQDRQHGDPAVEPRDMGRGEDRAVRDAVDHQPRDLARAGRQLGRGGNSGPSVAQVLGAGRHGWRANNCRAALFSNSTRPSSSIDEQRARANRRRSPTDSAPRPRPAMCRACSDFSAASSVSPSTSKPPPLGSEKRCE